MDMESIAALAAEGRDQRGMNIEYRVGICLYQLICDNDHKSGHHHQADIQLPEGIHQCHSHLPCGTEVLPGDGDTGNPRLLGTLQGIGVRIGGNHGGNLTVWNLTAPFRINQRLQIGAAAGDKNRDIYHSSTPFSPATHLPMR